MPKITTAIDDFGGWLLMHIKKQYPSVVSFVNANYEQKISGKYQYIARVIRSPKIIPRRQYYYEICDKLKILKPDRDIGLNLMIQREQRRSALQNDYLPKNTKIPSALLKSLSNHKETITLEDIGEIAKILHRLGERFTNDVIIEQIVAKYLESRESQPT